MDILVLAQEHTVDKSLWNPTILGILVVASAVVLFCGSIYLLLGTNLGARLGFLAAFTGLMGFMVVLSVLWMTVEEPLNTIKGRVPAWEVKQVVADLEDARIEEARTITENGEEVSQAEAANVKAAVDEALVTEEATAAEPEPPDKEFAEFGEVTEYLTGATYEIGGGSPNPLAWEFTHEPHVAAMEYCEVVEVETDPSLPPPDPECDPSSERQGFVILERDLGSLRVPPVVAFVMFSVLFVLGLLALHWREQDEAAVQGLRPVPAPVES